MRMIIVLCLILGGCALPRDMYLYKPSSSGEKAAIIGVSGLGAKLEKVDGEPFETFATRGAIHRVHIAPGTHTFSVIALSDFTLGYQTASHTRHEQDVYYVDADGKYEGL